MASGRLVTRGRWSAVGFLNHETRSSLKITVSRNSELKIERSLRALSLGSEARALGSRFWPGHGASGGRGETGMTCAERFAGSLLRSCLMAPSTCCENRPMRARASWGIPVSVASSASWSSVARCGSFVRTRPLRPLRSSAHGVQWGCPVLAVLLQFLVSHT
jgi:hypothetical protein